MKNRRTAAFSTIALAAMTALLASCADKNVQPPAELTEFRSTAKIDRVWSANVDGSAKLRLGLGLAISGDTVYAAGYDGDVAAFAAGSGKRQWQARTKLRLSGGPGVGDGLVVVGASYGDIVALDAATGAVKWKTRVNSEILAAPAVAAQTVLVRTVDGRLVALRATDGSQLWSAEQEVPRLSLRGTSRPLIVGNMAVCGFDNGRVLALSLADGGTLWDTNVSPPAGRTELDRVNDIDAALQAADNDIYAVTYQGKAARLDRESGLVQWSRDMSSYSGIALDDDGFYVTSADGAVVKIGRRTGVEMWKQEVLTRRRLSPPAVLGSLVAVADLQGYVHFLDTSNGELAARTRALGSRVSAAPVIAGDLLIMMDSDGKIVALRARPSAVAASATAPADAG